MTEQKLEFPDRPIGDVQILGVEALQLGGIRLVAKGDCKNLVEQIIKENCEFKGFEAFTIHPDASIQPHLNWSCDWPESENPTVEKVMKLINETPDDVTHFEFYFRPHQ